MTDNADNLSQAPETNDDGSSTPEATKPPPPVSNAKHGGLRLPAGVRSVARQLGLVIAAVVLFALGWLASPGDADEHQHSATSKESTEATLWTCSMHPQIKLPEPGACPICGMDLIPLKSDGADQEKNVVKLSKSAVQLAKIRTTPVYRAETSDTLRLLGRLEYDETAVRTITPWIGGRIDRLYVSTIGAKVKSGQPLAELYSPEVYAAQQDLIVGKKQLDAMADALPISRSAAAAALESARRRLRLLGIPEHEVDAMAKEKSPRERVVIRSTASGTVLEQMVNQGAYVTAGTPMFRVAALNRIWVQLDAYESDLARIKLGDAVEIQVTSYPGELFEGKVTFIDPIVDPNARTARVRIEVVNAKGRLRPGMFAVAVLQAPEDESRAEPPLVVPDTAVLFTGERSVVFVETRSEEGLSYEAREVQLGTRIGNVYPVVSGIKENERVVLQGAFTLDAELQIRGGQSMMTLPDDAARADTRPFDVAPKVIQRLSPLVMAYLDLSAALSKDDLVATKSAYAAIIAEAKKIQIQTPTDAAKRWTELREQLFKNAEVARDAPDLAQARQSFEAVSGAMTELLRRFGNPTKQAVKLAHCPMASGGEGAVWLQLADDVQNPYFGSEMYACGEIKGSAEPLGRLPEASVTHATPPTAAPGEHQH